MACEPSSPNWVSATSTNLNKELTIGFVGFGEAGFHIAKGFKSAGVSRIFAFDIHRDTPQLGEKIQRRAAETGTRLVGSSGGLAHSAEILFSTVTSDRAKEAAEQTAPFLGSQHIYADLNSVSPALKQAIQAIIESSGGGFVEAAVMSPVPPHGHRAPMLLGGKAAPRFAELMTPYGMRLDVISENVGVAAATKMFRSIIVKGLEALMFECVLAAAPYGADERVFSSLAESFPGIDWQKLANYMVGRVIVHGERRAHEMEEVSETLRSLGIDPIMAEATVRRQAWGGRLGMSSAFGPDGPKTYREVLEALPGLCYRSQQSGGGGNG
jgi:3-hydroxyisobutyrate dehydrogenase-like beta-hydroxyacid dehydrogenase